MNWNKIKIDKADAMFSKYMRLKIGQCEYGYCGRSDKLQVHHFMSRDHENTRFSEFNCIVLCPTHHRYFHSNPNIAVTFMKYKLGETEYDKLIVASSTYKKKDRQMEYLKAKALYEEEERKWK